MPVSASSTPNPNALKFTVGLPVGGPVTFLAGTDDPLGSRLIAVPGVTSVFMTADFVTVTKTPETDWSGIAPEVARILDEHQFEGDITRESGRNHPGNGNYSEVRDV